MFADPSSQSDQTQHFVVPFHHHHSLCTQQMIDPEPDSVHCLSINWTNIGAIVELNQVYLDKL